MEVEVDFISVEDIVAEDVNDGLQYQLPKHHRYSPADIFFLGEYTNTMAPVAKAIDILQGESVHMGWLLPTITTLIAKLERARVSLRFCKPLVDALLDGRKKTFGKMMSDPELVAAAILLPKFKTSWTSDEDVLKQGLCYIKRHLADHDESLQQPDSSSTSDEDDFFSSMRHGHAEETTKQLDAYLTCTAEGMDMLTSFPAVSSLSLKLPASFCCLRKAV
ncbi:uncharacterized protein LOC111225846 [Seriola dumerili]|uniref:uncharacterized protein LOC111225846 n=1 Tax=Seriola dumerili TaxID=41447 RepID=UPI000BBEBC44|nr:uncharacterized protein LOC111225846 [Seriola dumerili]